MDLLSQTEAQHRAICRARLQLDALVTAERKVVQDARAAREHQRALTAVKREIKELLVVVRHQHGLLEEMDQSITQMKAEPR